MARKRKRPRTRTAPKEPVTFESACRLLETALRGPTRKEILEALSKSGDAAGALSRLRDAMRHHRFQLAGRQLSLERFVQTFDEKTREDGFHVLQDWDGTIDRLNPETIPVDVAQFLLQQLPSDWQKAGTAFAILLDYYFLYLLTLLAMRVWDEGDPDQNLERVTGLVGDLQGADGSGQAFVGNAQTLILLATSHFEPDPTAYDRLLEKLRGLDARRRTEAALVVAGVLSSHLRFGYGNTYARSLRAMREDNLPDYPWLAFALASLMEAYEKAETEGVEGDERDRLVEGILNGLTPDTHAFLEDPPPALEPHEDERAAIRAGLYRYRADLLDAFQGHRPSERHYSPISFFFNFLHNTLKAIVVDALLRGEPWRVSMNDLLTGIPRGTELGKRREELARTLMAYARSSPDRIRGRLVPVIVYDPRAGRQAYSDTLRRLEAAGNRL